MPRSGHTPPCALGLWRAGVFLAPLLALGATASAQEPSGGGRQGVTVLDFDVTGVARDTEASIREELAMTLEISTQWQFEGFTGTSLQDFVLLLCDEPSDECFDSVLAQIKTESMISGSIARAGGAVVLTMEWRKKGGGVLARVEHRAKDEASLIAGAATPSVELIALAESRPMRVADGPDRPFVQPPPQWTPPPDGVREAEPLGLRLVSKAGAVVPRGDLQSGFGASLEVSMALPLEALSESTWVSDRFRVALDVGVQRVTQQATSIVPGRGRAGLIQNTSLVPLSLSLVYATPRQWPIQPYVGVGAGALMSRTEFAIFSETETRDEIVFSWGPVGGLQAGVDLGDHSTLIGVVEIRHREAQVELGGLGDVGEETLAGTSFAGGVGLEF